MAKFPYNPFNSSLGFGKEFIKWVNKVFGDVGSDLQENKSRVDNLIRNTPQPSEIVDLRLDEEGFEHPTAGDRLASDLNKINAAFEEQEEVNRIMNNIIISIEKYPRLNVENSDSPRLKRVIDYVFSRGGGTVTFPYGTFYDLTEQITLKRNVFFKGIDFISLTDVSKNVVFNCYYGENNESAAQILLDQCSGMKGITFFYPNQVNKDATTPVVYGYTIDMIPTTGYVDNIYLENIMLVNSYKALNLDKAGRFNISNIYGNPIKLGLRVDRVLDVSRAKHVHFWPFKYPSGSNLNNWIRQNGTAFELNGIDQLSGFDLFAFAYNTGFRIGAGFWGDLVSCVADGCMNPMYIDNNIDMLRFIGGTLVTVNYGASHFKTNSNVSGRVGFIGTDFYGASTIGPVISSDDGDFVFSGCHFKPSVEKNTNGWKLFPIVVTGKAAVKVDGCTGLLGGRVIGGANVKVDGVANFELGSQISSLNSLSAWSLSSGTSGYINQVTNGLSLSLVPGSSGATRICYMDYPIPQSIKNQQDVMLLKLTLSSTAASTAQRFSIKACRSDGNQVAELYNSNYTGVQLNEPITIILPIYFGFFKDDAVIRIEWQAFNDVTGIIKLENITFNRADTGKMTDAQLDIKLREIFQDPYLYGVTLRRRAGNRVIYSDRVPTSGEFAKGDIVVNISRDELGSSGSKYVISEWVCVSAGAPGTWLEQRVHTGN